MGQDLPDVRIRHKTPGVLSLGGQIEMHGPAVHKAQADAGKGVCTVDPHHIGPMHHFCLRIPFYSVEGPGTCGAFPEGILPGGLIINSGYKGQDRIRLKLHFFCIFFKKSPCILVRPYLQGTGHLFGPRVSGKGPCVVVFGQPAQRIHVVVISCPQPEGVGQKTLQIGRIGIVSFPQSLHYGPHFFHVPCVQAVQDLLSALSACDFRKYGQSDIGVQGRAYRIVLPR